MDEVVDLTADSQVLTKGGGSVLADYESQLLAVEAELKEV